MSVLDEIVTASEVAALCHLTTRAVRKACEIAAAKGDPAVRQSGATWLMTKAWADARWEAWSEDVLRCPKCESSMLKPLGDDPRYARRYECHWCKHQFDL